MLVYHGSNSNFKNLRISKSLVKSSATLVNEGIGIYFSTKREVAESYGKYIYTIEIDDKYITDFTKKSNCKKYINEIVKEVEKQTQINILDYFNHSILVECMFEGKVGICGTCREIELLLDSNEYWWSLEEKQINKVYDILKKYESKNLKAYLFNYNIENIGVIKKLNNDMIKIINKEKRV